VIPPLPNTDWPAVLRRFSTARILVVGDVMLDRYWYGTVSRVSPEAPVVVVSKTHAGGQVSLIADCGCDPAAAELRAALADSGVSGFLLLEDPARPTTVKTRVVAHQQHVVRIDEESTQPLDSKTETALLDLLDRHLPGTHAIILSDYAKGLLTESCVRAVRTPVFIDPKARDARRYLGATLLKPNRLELGLLTNAVVHDRTGTLAAANRLMESLPGTAILATEGAEGMTLFGPGSQPVSYSGLARALYDVTGAGDTVIATLALAVASGCDWLTAAHLANHAAARVVEKLGTTPCTAAELLLSLAASQAL